MNHGGNVWQGSDPAEWLDYSANIRPGGPPEWVRAALRGAMDNVSYYPQLTMDRAGNALAAFLGVRREQVLPTAGGIAAISLATRLGAERVRVPAPSFLEYSQLAEGFGLPVEPVSMLDGHRVLSPAETLGRDLRENTLLWLCSPWNPVGAGFSPREVEALLAAAEAKNCFLAVDEAFIHYCPENTVLPLIEDHPRLIVTGSLTKILGIPGVRLGYLCAGALMERLSAGQDPWELNCFAEAVAMALPEHREDPEAECVRSRLARERLRAGLEELGVFVYPSQANFLLCDLGRDVRPIEDYLFERKILVRRCMNFRGIDDGRHLRLAVKDEASDTRFLNTLREALQCAGNH